MRHNSVENSFASVVDHAITDAKSQMNGLEFMESPQGPRIHLLPVQRVLFKAALGIPMDCREGKVQVWDSFRENILYTLSDRDYLRYVADQGRCNFSDWRDLPPNGFNEIEIIAGRRGGKALGMDEPIPTPNGWVLNRDLKTGDKVFGPEGFPVNVTMAHEPFEDEAFQVAFDDGSTVTAHGGHLWQTRTADDPTSAVRTTEEIRDTLSADHSIPLAAPIALPEVALPMDPFVFGLRGDFTIPDPYLWSSAIQRRALLDGLVQAAAQPVSPTCMVLPTQSQRTLQLVASLGYCPYLTQRGVTWDLRSSHRHIVSVEPVGRRMVRCITVDHPKGLFLFGKNFNTTHNSILISALAVEKLRQLLNVKNPHEIYRVVEGDFIDFTILAQDENGAGRLYSRIKQALNRAEFFRPFVFGKPGVDNMGLITEADRLRRDIQPSIMLTAWPCTTRSSRGPNSYFLALDEFAHFRSATGSSSDDVYEAATPSTARFIRREHGQEFLDSMTVIVTSPWTKVGKTYQLMSDAMAEGKDSSIFFYQCSSAEMAGTEISPVYLRNKFRRDPVKWQAEYGGKFLESAGSFVPISDIDACIDKDRGNNCAFDPRNVGVTYFWGLDLGIKKDATAIAISHWEQEENGLFLLVYDYIDRMMVGEGVWENVPELDPEAILDWCWDLNQWFPGKYGCTDQYAGAMFLHSARQRQLEFFELVHLTEAINSEMYFALQGYIHQHVCRFPNVPKFRHELGTVEAFFVGKHRIRVEAPTEKNAHDDMCDAAALSAWRAQKWMLEEKAKGYAFSGESIRQAGNKLRPGDLGVNPDISPMSMIRVAERERAMARYASASEGTILLPPRLLARRGRF